MSEPDVRLEITVNQESLKISEEMSEELTTKLALVSGLAWNEAKKNLDQTLALFSRSGSLTNSHITDLSRWI